VLISAQMGGQEREKRTHTARSSVYPLSAGSSWRMGEKEGGKPQNIDSSTEIIRGRGEGGGCIWGGQKKISRPYFCYETARRGGLKKGGGGGKAGRERLQGLGPTRQLGHRLSAPPVRREKWKGFPGTPCVQAQRNTKERKCRWEGRGLPVMEMREPGRKKTGEKGGTGRKKGGF